MRPAFLAFVLLGCASTPEGTLSLVLGEETDALTRSPAPATLVLEAIDANGRASEVARAALPTSRIDLGSRSKDEFFALRVTGVDPAGKPLVWGQSIQFQAGALEDRNVPVFVQRVGEFARMPSRKEGLPQSPLLSLVAGRYVFVGSDTSFDLYDLTSYTWLDAQPKLPRPARSLVVRGTRLFVIDDQGGSLVDLSSGASADVRPPSGGSFAEVAGGATVSAEDGTQFVVGATRPAPESQRVLRVDRDGTLTFIALTAPRSGAGAAWIAGRGLFVFGGSATAPGAELVAPGEASAGALPYPPSGPSPGNYAAPLEGSRVLVIGAANPSQPSVVDLGCTSSCAPTPRGGALPAGAAAGPGASLVAIDARAAMLLVPGADRAFLLGEGDVFELPLKQGRQTGAKLLRLDNGATIAAGGAPYLESFAPVIP